MSTLKQNTADFKDINTASFDLFKNTAEQWREMLNRAFVNSGKDKQIFSPWLTAAAMKSWPEWIFSFNAQRDQMKKILAANLEQQKLCSNLTTSLFTCTTKTMEALRSGAQNQTDPAETIKICQALAADYRRSCADFIESECALFCAAWRSPKASGEKNEKTEMVNAKTKPAN